MITLFYVKDVRGEHRLFSSEPVGLAVKPSKAKAAWELAKRKLMLLPQRTLRQEQALGRALRMTEPSVRILHGAADAKHLNLKFKFFLNRVRGRRLAMLIGERILVPPSGLVALLPGPNVVFYALALLIITHWQSFRGVRHLLRKSSFTRLRRARGLGSGGDGEARGGLSRPHRGHREGARADRPAESALEIDPARRRQPSASHSAERSLRMISVIASRSGR